MSLSSSVFLNESDYTWNKALLWGHSIGHFKKCQKGSFRERTVHLIIAVTEALPIIGQIISIFETAIYKLFFCRFREESHPPTQTTKITNEGIAHYHQRDFKKATESFLRDLEIKKNIYGEKDARIINSLADVGNGYYHQLDYPKAFEYFSSALKICEESTAHDNQTDFKKTIEAFLRALETEKNGYGEEDPRLINSLHVLAEIYYLHPKDLSKAITCSLKTLEINEKKGLRFSIVNDLSRLIRAYRTQGDIEKANEFFIRVLKIGGNTHREEVYDTIHILITLGKCYFEQKDFSKAIEILIRALRIGEDAYGESFFVQKILIDLGTVYSEQKDFSKAIEAFTRALRIQENSYGEESLWIVDQLLALGDACNEQGDFSKAVECFRRAFEISENSYRKGDSDRLAIAYQNHGGVEKAIELFRRKLEAAKSSLESIPVDREQ